MVKIGDTEIRGDFTLAPMAGVSDFAFRRICRELGAGLTCTEMISSKALVYHDEKTKELLFIPEDEHPSAVQIFGHEPDVMAEAAAMAIEQSGADLLDINCGCPVGKIVKSGDGSALMKDPELAGRIVEAVCRTIDRPVTVKFRKGFDGGNVNAVEFARIMEQSGASAVAVHGRTRAQMYSGHADWDIIRDVKKAVKIPVLANGDVFSREDGEHILRYTGADLAMVGRGSFGNPWIFSKDPLPPLGERMDTAYRHIELLAQQRGEHSACMEARHLMGHYLHGVAHSSYYRQQIVQVETLEDIRKIVSGIKHDLK